MHRDPKSVENPNSSGLNSIAKNAIRLHNKLLTPNPPEVMYHVMATMHVWTAVTYIDDISNFERLRFFYDNGYATNLIIKAGQSEAQIRDYASHFYRHAKTVKLKEELRQIIGYLSGLKPNPNDNTLFEIFDYEPKNGGELRYEYSSMLGKCTITVDEEGGYNLDFHKIL
ncbi:MAG: hypothetical protein KGH54_01505 [Candidatus Micrarchaeota archaeon]|nr:hypothetical protein [Candidatus Micrarchaeota archaeon]